MKKQIMTGLLVLSLAVPGVAAAKGMVNENNTNDNAKPHAHHGRHMDKADCKAKMQERQQQLLSWVEKYTPEQKDKWNQAIAERKSLHQKIMSPEFAAKREAWMKARKNEKQELKKQLEEGKITEAEFKKKLMEKRKEFHKQKRAHFQTYRDLKKAVKDNDQQQAAKLLNQLLTQMEQHNQMIKTKINQ